MITVFENEITTSVHVLHPLLLIFWETKKSTDALGNRKAFGCETEATHFLAFGSDIYTTYIRKKNLQSFVFIELDHKALNVGIFMERWIGRSRDWEVLNTS